MTDLTLHTLAERPDLVESCWDLTHLWPRFMLEDPIADLYFSRLETYGETALVAVAPSGETVARAFAVPFAMGEAVDRPVLPADGWDGVIRWAWLDSLVGRPPTLLSMLEVTVAPSHRGTGVPQLMLQRMKDVARDRGLASVVAPVRPSRKAAEPETPMAEYVARTGADGLPADPWLRTHVRMGAEIVGVCPRSMTISGSLAEWRAWSGLPLEESGAVALPGGLAPLHVDVDQDHAVYVEPNVWMRHPL